jgi:hypothetical protein
MLKLAPVPADNAGMRRLRGPSAVVAAVTAAAALLTGCAGRGPTTLTAGDRPPADGGPARLVVVHGADLPGFDESPPTALDPAGARAAGDFEACAGAAATLDGAEHSAVSPGFVKGRSTLVTSLAIVSPDRRAAEKAMDNLSRSDLGACLTELFTGVLSLDLLPGATTRTELLPAREIGDQSVTWRTTISVGPGTNPAQVFSDLTFVRSGRTVAALFSVGVGEPFPSAERARVLARMLDRM